MPPADKWTIKRFFLTAVFAAATFAASFSLGNAITLALGPGTSGIATIIITTVVVVIGARIIGAIGVFTLMVLLFTALAIPTNMFGPPGPQKLLIGAATGFVYDLLWNLGKRKRFSLPIAAAIATAVSILLIFWLMVFLNHPRKDYLYSILGYTLPVYAVLGFLGALLGNWIFDRYLSRLSVVKQLQS